MPYLQICITSNLFASCSQIEPESVSEQQGEWRHAGGDLAVPVRMGRYLADKIPNSKFLEIAGVDHCDLGYAPEAISKIETMLQAQPT